MRQQFCHPLDPQGRHSRRNLLRLPSVLHRQAKAGRYGRPRRALPPQVCQGGDGCEVNGAFNTKQKPPICGGFCYKVPITRSYMTGSFETRARQLMDAISLLQEDLSSYASAVALLSVHSAIAYNDAIQIKISGTRKSFDDHRQTAIATRKLCRSKGYDCDGLRHLETLLGRKSEFSYSETLTLPDVAYVAVTHARRFESWALQILRRN